MKVIKNPEREQNSLHDVIFLDSDNQPITGFKKDNLFKQYKGALMLNFKEKALVNVLTNNRKVYISWNPYVFSFDEIQNEIKKIKEEYNSPSISEMAILYILADNLPTVEIEIVNDGLLKV